MREIKFRAWDTFNGVMVFATMADLLNGTQPLDFRVLAQENQLSDIMQFTGLKDKNGKEIYEGDIVKITTYIGGNFIDERNEIAQVIYQGVSFQYLPIDANKIYMVSMILNGIEKCEVIGNIYENKELLK